MFSSPPSTSRVMSARSPAISSLEINAACGQPSSADSICPVWLQSSSIACLPVMTNPRSEEHTSELSHLGISYAVFCLKKKKKDKALIKKKKKKKNTQKNNIKTLY